MSEQKIKFALQDFNRFIDDENAELAIAKCCFLSTKPNSHGLIITEDVLRRDSNTILGKFLIGNMDFFESDVKGHETKPEIYGYFPENQEIEFVEEEGYLLAYANAVVSKIYATSFYNIFVKDNFRNTSVEMLTKNDEDDENLVVSFNICGLTSLGRNIDGSCPNANMEMIRFSQDEANDFYNKSNLDTNLSKFAKDRKEKLIDKKYKIDKSKDSLSNEDWSSVNKTIIRNKILEATNSSLLIKSVYLLVEDGWEDAPSEHLKYPVMQLKGDTFVYNRNALANAKARATQQNEANVLNKIDSIYNKLDLNEKEVKSEKMSDMKDNKAEQEKLEDNKETEKLEKEPKDDNKEISDEKLENDEKLEDNENIIMEDSDDKDDKDYDDKDCEDKMSLEQAMEKLAEKDEEIKELKKFKDDTLESQKMSIVNLTLAQIKEHTKDDVYAKFEKSGKECKFENITGWKNEVLASIAIDVLQKSEKIDEDFTRMSLSDDIDDKSSNSLWDRL